MLRFKITQILCHIQIKFINLGIDFDDDKKV